TESLNALVDLLTMPNKCLAVLRGGARYNDNDRVSREIGNRMSGLIREIQHESTGLSHNNRGSVAYTLNSNSPHQNLGTGTNSFEINNQFRSRSLACNGYLRRAMAQLDNVKQELSHSQMLEKLRSLHPVVPTMIPSLPTNGSETFVDGDDINFRTLLKSMDTGSSGGIS